jgi:hypothetical protein
LALFVAVGIAVAFVSLASPALEPYDARARILFRGQSGKHIDYFISEIKKSLEQHYGEAEHITVTVSQYHEGERVYLLSTEHGLTIRSALDDVETYYKTAVKLERYTHPPAGGTTNKLSFLRVDDRPVAGLPKDFGPELKPYGFLTRLEEGKTAKVEYLTETWTGANAEGNTYSTKRYTRRLILRFENRLPKPLSIQLKQLKEPRFDWTEIKLAPGQKALAPLELEEMKRDEVLFDFKVMAPAE